MPKFEKNLLIIHAHPDDTEAFCAGTVQLLADRGYHVTIATMTAGGIGGIGMTEAQTINTRKAEARAAAAAINADYVCLDQRDGYVFDHEAIRITAADLIRRTRAGIVMTHLPFDYHADHRATCSIVDAAAMLAALPNVPCDAPPLDITPLLYHTAPLGFSDPLGEPITPPHFYIDITTTINAKLAMLAEHHSQIELMRVMHKMDNFMDELKAYNVDLGQLAGVDYAEAFWQHNGGGFQKDPLIQTELRDFLKQEITSE